ncbi:MAG TPA: hypothetical protein DCL44_05180 [Elusimicrobia bacterium]|nr:hypothetical protein [Elusimicrobiota bacterium]
MSKKHKEQKPQQNALPPAPAAAAPSGAEPAQQAAVTPFQKQAIDTPAPSMKKHLLFFWSAVILAVALSWTIQHFMPLTHEYVIERWVMLGFGGFLAVFLFFLK